MILLFIIKPLYLSHLIYLKRVNPQSYYKTKITVTTVVSISSASYYILFMIS